FSSSDSPAPQCQQAARRESSPVPEMSEGVWKEDGSSSFFNSPDTTLDDFSGKVPPIAAILVLAHPLSSQVSAVPCLVWCRTTTRGAPGSSGARGQVVVG